METKKNRSTTRLNPAFRNELGINSRTYKCGCPVELSIQGDPKGCGVLVRVLDQDTTNGGKMTPFNIQCLSDGACAISKIIFDGDDTIVLFADGDHVHLHRHGSDANDPVTAVLWALGEKVFGTELARQIHRAIKVRGRTIEQLRDEKRAAKAAKAAKASDADELTIINE